VSCTSGELAARVCHASCGRWIWLAVGSKHARLACLLLERGAEVGGWVAVVWLAWGVMGSRRHHWAARQACVSVAGAWC
jgi:hypothetical protein